MPIYRHLCTSSARNCWECDAGRISLSEDISAQEETTSGVPKLGTFDERLDAIAAHKARGRPQLVLHLSGSARQIP